MVRFVRLGRQVQVPRRLLILLTGILALASHAHAQAPVVLSGLLVQLWPEYDQPSMLVIYDFNVAEGTTLPVGVTIRYPKDANLMAVAVHQDQDTLLNADYLESAGNDEWQSVIVQVQSPSTYRVEYFQPLTRSGNRRTFTYSWSGHYAVQDFNLTVRLPADATVISANPALQRGESDGPTYFMANDFDALEAGEPFDFRLEYSRSSDALVAPSGGLAPSEPLGANTAGRVMLSNYLPYALGGLGAALLLGGGAYIWLSGRAGDRRLRPRHRGSEARLEPATGSVYCPQCGTRAQAGDRFCRVCGTRLRPPE